MKISCDVCEQAEAVVYCCADEAALCEQCDFGVHHANKLSKKHLRFSLVHPSFKDALLCDICQERTAFLLCQEDRAILCTECESLIHKANEHIKKHNRFLVTGVKLSISTSTYPTTTTTSSCNNFQTSTTKIVNHKKPASSSSKTLGASVDDNNTHVNNNVIISANGSTSTSSILEYLETVPSFRVDDFLDPHSFDNYDNSCNSYKTWNSQRL